MRLRRSIVALLPALALSTDASAGSAAPLATDWVSGFNSKVRLVAGEARGEAIARDRLVAGVEIVMPPGWKTYWRTPGEAGGIPPEFDWSGSANLKSASPLYPVPERFVDKSGETLGYQGSVVFPILIEPERAGAPIELKGKISYGICKDICVPAESELSLTIPPTDWPAVPDVLAGALEQVPRPSSKRRPQDPELKSARVDLQATPPRLTVEALFGQSERRDLFVSEAGGLFVPQPTALAVKPGGLMQFEADLSSMADFRDLKGKTLTFTLVGDKGQTEATFTVE